MAPSAAPRPEAGWNRGRASLKFETGIAIPRSLGEPFGGIVPDICHSIVEQQYDGAKYTYHPADAQLREKNIELPGC